MTKEEASKRIADLRKQGKTVFDLTFQEPCVEFFREEVTEIQLSTDDFHFKLWPKNEIVDYKKQFIMALGMAAGIIVIDINHRINSNNRFVHEATCYLRRPTPKGTNQELSAEGCYDVEARFAIEEANDIIKYEKWKDEGGNGEQQGGKYCTKNERLNEALKTKRKAEMAQHGAQQADTNAHERAIKKMLNLPPATEKKGNNYIMPNAVIFISCVKPNLENKDLRNRFLNSYFGGAANKELQFENQQALPEPEQQNTEPETITAAAETIAEDLDRDANLGFTLCADNEDIDYSVLIDGYLNSDIIKAHPARIAFQQIAKSVIESGSNLKECADLFAEFLDAQNNRERVRKFLALCLFHPAVELKIDLSKSIKNVLLNPKPTKEELELLIGQCSKLIGGAQ